MRAIKHPELRPGEVLLANLPAEVFEQVKWKTKRLGTTARDESGKQIEGRFPVFVMRSELENKGIAFEK